MHTDPFFNRITLQLIRPPFTSTEALKAAAQGSYFSVESRFEVEIESAKSWVAALLKTNFHPPPATIFLAFPLEEGVIDTIRASYKINEIQLEIAQSRYLICFKMKGLQYLPEMSEKDRSECTARKVFIMGDRIHFRVTGPFNNGVCGTQDLSFGQLSKAWPHWLDSLRWCYEGEEVSFIALKATGGPTKAVISPNETTNKHWFYK